MKFIYSADNHLTVNAPVCRTDNFLDTLENILKWLNTQLKKHNAIHISGGDIIDRDIYNGPNMLLDTINFILNFYPDTIGIVGNHDVRYKSMKYLDKSIISTLVSAGVFTLLTEPYEIEKNVWLHPFNWGSSISHIENIDDYPEDSKHIAIYHGYVYKEKTSIINGFNAKDLLYNFPEYDMILTGDHHQSFVETLEGQVLINSGPLYRADIDHIDYQPVVWLIDTDDLSYSSIDVPTIDGEVSVEHKDKKARKEYIMDSVVDVVNAEGGSSDKGIKFENEVYALKEENKKVMNEEIEVLLERMMEEGEE